MLRDGFYRAFFDLAMLVNREQAIVEDSFHKIWNRRISKSDFGLALEKNGKKRKSSHVVHTPRS